MATKLPTPATSGEMYMAAIVEQLEKLNKTLKELTNIVDEATTPDMPELTEVVELKEPVVNSDPPKASKSAHRDAKQAEEKASK